MVKWISGQTVTLYERTESGADDFGAPLFTETPVEIADVIVSPASGPEIVDTMNLYGKKAVLSLHIPKGDTHAWRNCNVDIGGTMYHVIGEPIEYMEHMVPLDWNKTVQVENVVYA